MGVCIDDHIYSHVNVSLSSHPRLVPPSVVLFTHMQPLQGQFYSDIAPTRVHEL